MQGVAGVVNAEAASVGSTWAVATAQRGGGSILACLAEKSRAAAKLQRPKKVLLGISLTLSYQVGQIAINPHQSAAASVCRLPPMMLQHGPTQHHLATCAVLLPAAALLLLAAAKVHRMQGDAELATVQRPAAVHCTHLTVAH